MAKGGRKIPKTMGRELSNFTSWKTVSNTISGIRDNFKRLGQQARETRAIYEASAADARKKNYGRFVSGLSGVQGNLQGKIGHDVDGIIQGLFKEISHRGGENIDTDVLSRVIEGARSKIISKAEETDASGKSLVSENERQLLNQLSDTLKKAEEQAAKGGFGTMGGSSRDAIQAAFEFQKNNTIDKALSNIEASINATAGTLSDSGLKSSVENIKNEMNAAAKAAKNSAEKQQAVADAASKLSNLTSGTSGADKTAMDSLSKNASLQAGELKKTILAQTAKNKAESFKEKAGSVAQGFSNVIRYLGPLKRSFDVSNAMFQAVNQKVNQFARMQMGVSAERGAYGRLMRGAGLNFSSMMSAIGTGRRAGMDDRVVVDKMATIQEQLARARWGEGPIIENLGKWGLTPFDENGNMKDFNRVMIDISNKFNTLGSDMERLQFISMQGFKPEQMEYVKNYARDAQAWAEMKKHPERMGVLEQARYLDESGMAAKIDAATKIELKRREILNQNALEDGAMASIVRGLHPENWFFEDWTARSQGVQSAKSAVAMEALQKELERVRSTLKANNGNLESLKNGLVGSIANIEGLAYRGGAAEADIKNRGEKSSIYQLRKIYAQDLGIEDLTQTESRNSFYNGAIGVAGGALGSMGIASMLGLPLGLLGMLITGLIGGAIGGFGMGSASPFSIAQSGEEKHIEALRKMRGDPVAMRKYIQEHKLYGLTPEMVESRAFSDNEKASGMLQAGHRLGLIYEAQGLTGKAIDAGKAANYTDDVFFQANQRVAESRGEKISRQQTIEAIARAGTGDKNIGMDAQTAYNYAIHGFDENTVQQTEAFWKKKGELRSKWVAEGKKFGSDQEFEDALQKETLESMRQEFVKTITPGMYQKAKGIQGSFGSSSAEAEWRAAERDAGLRKDKFAGGGEEVLENLKRQIKTIEDIGPEGIERNRKEYDGLKRILSILTKYGSKEKFIKQRQDVQALLFGGKETPFAFKSEEEQRSELNEILKSQQTQEGRKTSLGAQLSRLARQKDVSKDLLRNSLFSSEEAENIEKRIEKGEKLDSSTSERWEEYKKGSNYQNRQTRKEEEAKRKEEEKKSRFEELVGLREMERAGVGLSYQQRTQKEQLEKEFEKEQPQIDSSVREKAVQRAIKTAEARGNVNIDEKFDKKDVAKYRKEEAKRKKLFISEGLGDEGQYEDYKAVEAAILSGENVNEKDRDFYNDTKSKLDEAVENAREMDEDDSAEIEKEEEDFIKNDEDIQEMLAQAGAAAETGKKRKERGNLNELSDLRQMDEFTKKGMGRRLRKRYFGKDRNKAYEEGVKEGKYKDYAEERKKKKREDYEKLRRKQLEEDWGTGEENKKRVQALLDADMAQYDADVAEREKAREEKEDREEARDRATGTEKSGFLPEVKELTPDERKAKAREKFAEKMRNKYNAMKVQIDDKWSKEQKERVFKQNAALDAQMEQEMQGYDSRHDISKEDLNRWAEASNEGARSREEIVAQMQAASESTEGAAASAANASNVTNNVDRSTEVSVEGAKVTINVQGTYPMDEEGMKRGVASGVDMLVDASTRSFIDAMNGTNMSLGTC